MFTSIRSILYFSFLIIGISLFLVIILGVRQYQVSSRYNETTALSERALFAFGTIREQITESLIAQDYRQLRNIIPEIESLNNVITGLYDSDAIPGHYKLAMADKIDLTGLVIAMRKLQGADGDPEVSLELQQNMRLIAERLIKVDRIISAQIRDSLLGFQLSVIGAMGVLISCASFILLVLYRKALKPLLILSAEAQRLPAGEAGINCPSGAGAEIIALIDSVNEAMRALQQAQIREPAGEQEVKLSETVNETVNSLNGIINYAQLLLESDDQENISTEQQYMLGEVRKNAEAIAKRWSRISAEFSEGNQ